jgi:hypothetical protein
MTTTEYLERRAFNAGFRAGFKANHELQGSRSIPVHREIYSEHLWKAIKEFQDTPFQLELPLGGPNEQVDKL